MKYKSGADLQRAILTVLHEYCNNYILFKPTYYFIAKKYIEKINEVDYKNSLMPLLKLIFDIYKNHAEKNSETFATNIGLILAEQLEVNKIEFLKYREARILTQRYIKGFGLYESQTYKKVDNQFVSEISVDPLYSAYWRLVNVAKLNRLIPIEPMRAHNREYGQSI